MYTIAEDGTLNKDGKMCFCMNTDTSCTASCAAFEERVKDRVWLACMSREIVAKPEGKSPVVNAMKNTPSADPLGIDELAWAKPDKPAVTKGKRRTRKP